MKEQARGRVIILIIALACCLLSSSSQAATNEPAPMAGPIGSPSGAPAVTVSGTISHDSLGVSNVSVEVLWDGGGKEVTTAEDGQYSVAGVAASGPVQIFVRPPISAGLAFRNWGSDDLGGDLVKDFELEDGHRLQGEFRTPDGAPLERTFWLSLSARAQTPPEGEWLGDTAIDGAFDLVLPPDIYTIDTSLRPYFVPPLLLDLRSGDATDQVITLLDEIPPAFPTTPPDASLIRVGEPDTEGYASVTGDPDAVEPHAAVVLVNLSTNNLITTTADAAGAFAATLYAPPGSSLLVKYDRVGDRVRLIWQDALADGLAEGASLNPLPGTILHVGPPPSGADGRQPFYTAGRFREDGPLTWAGWWISGTLQVPDGAGGDGLNVEPGDAVDLSARIRVTSPGYACDGALPFEPVAHVSLRYLFDDQGHSDPWGIWFNAHLFTPTGLPIEHEASGETMGVGSFVFSDLKCVSDHSFEGFLQTTFEVPADLPDGVYRVEAFMDPGGDYLSPDVLLAEIWYHHDPIAPMPVVTVGAPAPPHIPWTLLGDYPVNGHRGLQAQEDVDHFAMPTRVVFPPHQAVIPRLDARTGNPIAYRLEPGSHWLSATDRRQPCPPHLPLALPSGELTVEVHKPDGATETLGPASIVQSSVRTPTTPGGSDLASGTGQVADLYHLSTMDESFAYAFDQDGLHTIELSGSVSDVHGNVYPISGTYDVVVGRVLDLDPGQLPTTPYEQGNAFAPGLHVFPPVPAEVTVELVQMPESDPDRAITDTITGQANRFGVFQPPAGTVITMTAPGEFRVDLTATYEDPDGSLWAGAMTWGNVIEGPDAAIKAHGRRGMDYHDNTIDDMPPWFRVFDLPPEKVGIENYYPYFSGDIHWGNEDRQPGDSIHSIITVEDLTSGETIYELLRANYPRARSGFRWPPTDTSLSGLESRLEIDEAPLFITTDSGIDPAVEPGRIDQFAYWYGSSERPDVRVREILSEDNMGTAYWRFDDTYGYQIGESAVGDLPGDLKWEFGGAVFRMPGQSEPLNEYAIYSSLWVLLPHGCDDYGCARVTAPFRGAGDLNGGPILQLLGEDIDMLFLPKSIRPGDVLETGDVVAFSGHVGPPLNSRVAVTVTSPSGNDVLPAQWDANKIGWHYDPGFDFVVQEPGRWTVDVLVEHDKAYEPTGHTPTDHNTGTVLGTQGRYAFYVVDEGSQRLTITSPEPGFITWPEGRIEPIHIRGLAPAGTTAVHYTVHDKGVVMAEGSVTPASSGAFTVTYDARALNEDFPMLSLTAHEGLWEGLSDEVAINLLATGAGAPRANTVTLIGEEVFVGSDRTNRLYLPLVLRDQ